MMRNFQKLNSEKIRLAAAPLLKSFHNEIDSLSKRSKFSEKAFFDIYKKSCNIAIPVPVPTLEYYIGSMKSLQPPWFPVPVPPVSCRSWLTWRVRHPSCERLCFV